MVNAVYDHIVAILVVGSVFVGAVVALPNINLANLETVDQQQLRNTALNVFNTMLLDTGHPGRWGAMDPFYMDDSRVERFGLASSKDSVFYVLDSDKVQRIIEGNPLNYCRYEKIRELLALQNYGFSLRIIPPFNVTFERFELYDDILDYQIRVTHNDGRPIPNAKIQGAAYYTTKKEFFIDYLDSISTDEKGVCNGSLVLEKYVDELKSIVVVLRVTVADVATLIVTHQSGEHYKITDINLVGDTLILTRTKETPNDNVWIMNGTFVGSDGKLIYLFNSTAKNDQDYKLNTGEGSPYRLWSRLFAGLSQHDPHVFVFNYWAVDPDTGRGRCEIVIAGPYQNMLGHYNFRFGGEPSSRSASVRIQRSVIISGMTYTADLLFWKEST